MQVVTAVGEAFNNIVLHSYAGREDGIVEMDIKTQPDHISIEFRDWGDSFDPDAVPTPRSGKPSGVGAGHLHHQNPDGHQLRARKAQRAYTFEVPRDQRSAVV